MEAHQELNNLCARIKADLRARFERGEDAAVADYLEASPQLGRADSRMISLIYEEYCLREERGDDLDVESFCNRYPAWKDSVASQLQYHHLLSNAPALPMPKSPFPEPGELFEEFELGPQIGKGGYSRVFVAYDLSLGRKRVVLKVSVDRGQEAETQGALDHPHIVPVNAVVYPPDHGLRGLSMPFRLGSPLDDVIRRVRQPAADHPRTARVFWDALVKGIGPDLLDASGDDLGPVLAAGPREDGWRGFPVHGSFARGAAWIGMILANALDYAHRRKTFHRDVKPGNVLLTLQHGPQLLDFNLAHSSHAPQEAAATFGGTLPYMAPEQIQAFLVPELWPQVGALADVYSLGLVLHELLTGRTPDLPDPAVPPPQAMRELLDRRATMSTDVRVHNPQVPYALEAIVKKCLCLDPQDRYETAGLLAEDLRNFLDRRPLSHASNPSRTERLFERAVRNRRLLAANVFYLGILALLSPIFARQAALWLQPALKDRREFRQAVAAVDARDYNRAVELFQKLVEDYPRSPLPHFYLGIATSRANRLPKDPALASYGRAMELPGADAELRSWARKHPSFVEDLRWFGANSLIRSSEIVTAARKDQNDPAASEDPKLQSAIRHVVTLGDHALVAALDVDPTSRIARQNRATIAEHLQDLDAAYTKLTDLIEPTGTPKGVPSASELSSWRIQRARVGTRRARRLMTSNAESDRRRALEFVDQADADLELCSRAYVDSQRLFYYSYRVEALLTRSEIHCLLRDERRAQIDVRAAKQNLDIWLELARASGSPVPVAEERNYLNRIRAVRKGVALARNSDPGAPPEPLKRSE